MMLSTFSIVTKAVACSLLMLALAATTTHVVNGEEKIIIVNCRVIIHLCYDYVSITSFLFDTHPNIILHASCLLLFKPSQLRVVMVIAIVILLSAAVQRKMGSSVVWIKPHMTNE